MSVLEKEVNAGEIPEFFGDEKGAKDAIWGAIALSHRMGVTVQEAVSVLVMVGETLEFLMRVRRPFVLPGLLRVERRKKDTKLKKKYRLVLYPRLEALIALEGSPIPDKTRHKKRAWSDFLTKTESTQRFLLDGYKSIKVKYRRNLFK